VVIVPGIMGSELVDAGTGRVLWGLADPRWYLSAWTSGRSLESLRLSDDERAGRYGRVRAGRALRFPAFAPFLAGFEPYTALLKGALSAACHAAAVTEFAYDWRLPVAHNGNLLASFAHDHLAAWQAHPGQAAARQTDPGGDQPARLVLVAHSMGGLLARQACLTPGFAEDVRAVVTLGTPFFGAPKAVLMLATGQGTPLPRARTRRLAAGLPGLHDLLPAYRCVSDGPGARRLTPGDITSLGGDAELAAASLAWHESVAATGLPGHVQVVGAHQPTIQAVTISAGAAAGHLYTYQPTPAGVQRIPAGGDGTVPRVSAQLPGPSAMPLAQSHGALASSTEAILIAHDVLTSQRTGPWQGAGEYGLDVPDMVAAGQSYRVTVTGAEHSADVTCSVVDVATGLRVDTPEVGCKDGAVVGRARALPAGLYRVRISGGGASPVTQIIMSVPGDFAVPGQFHD